MDFGCSRHMTGHHKWFSSLNPMSTKEYITFGIFAFVRNLGFNLVSVSQLLDEGFEVRFKKGVCRVLDAEETLVFRVDLTSVSGPARYLVASLSADIWKWHRRHGHLSFDLLVRLSSMGLIQGLPKLRAEKDLVMTSYPGELLHMDTVGPARVASVNGKWYVLVVVDDFSRFSWVFFMEFKDEVFGFVRDLAIRAIRSDNGGEFRNSRFKNFCHDLGLEHQFSSPYSPPQNGVVEYKNRTLVEMARTMLDEHRTPRHFWAEAVNTACYIANRIFLRAFLGKTSYELRFGRQPSVKHLRAFGCRHFVLKKAGHLDKFESRCLDGIFLGYASSSRAFHVWILKTKQVVETCEVFFDETMPCTTPAFELSGDDEEGTPIFEDEEGADDVGDAGATAPAAAPAPSATSSDDEGGPLPTTFSSLPRQQAQAEAGPAKDAGEVTSEIVPPWQVQRDHPPHRMIGDIHQRVTRSSVASLAFFYHATYVATFEPRDVAHALSDSKWVNAMHEEETMSWIYSRSASVRATKLLLGLLTVKRYLKFTPELGLWYSSGSSLSLRGFSDADHDGCRIDRKSTSGTCQLLGTSLVSWSSLKQASLLWMKATLSDFGLRFGKISFLVNSTSAISVAKNPVLHSRTKHIDVRFHFLRDHYEKGDIDLIHVVSANQLADIFTKPLEFDAFTRLRGYRLKVLTMHQGGD
ncbi:hypothetical protein U9M48_028236 [Paspalum notatum var. saurae]|uniref:Integrase catalytic domain-containing protein n=1 Tax=Paspalum notatum var. saurae TaxID=547442 RepID=A0AAQ3X1A9_PASNO